MIGISGRARIGGGKPQEEVAPARDGVYRGRRVWPAPVSEDTELGVFDGPGYGSLPAS
jgi:hypothetical protein